MPETSNGNQVIGNMLWKDLMMKLYDHKFNMDQFISNLTREEAELFQDLNKSTNNIKDHYEVN